MKALLIIAVILLLLILLTFLYAKLYVKYENEEATLYAGVLFFRFQLFPKKEAKPKKEKKAKGKTAQSSSDAGERKTVTATEQKMVTSRKTSVPDKAEAATKDETEKKPKKSKEEIKETITAVFDILRSILQPAHFALRHMKITDLRLNVVVGGDEPDETAIRYGRWNAAVYGGLATLRNFMTVKCKKLVIAVDFSEPDTRLSADFTIKVRIFVLLIAVVRMIFRFLVNTLKRNKESAVQTA